LPWMLPPSIWVCQSLLVLCTSSVQINPSPVLMSPCPLFRLLWSSHSIWGALSLMVLLCLFNAFLSPLLPQYNAFYAIKSESLFGSPHHPMKSLIKSPTVILIQIVNSVA
jgi:hypothetical protein